MEDEKGSIKARGRANLGSARGLIYLGAMDISITLNADSEDREELTLSLYRGLQDEDLVNGSLSLQRSSPGPDEMGGVVEAIAVALGSGGVAAAAASVIVEWLRQRRGDIKVTVERSDGSSMLVEVNRIDTEADFVKRLEVFLSESADG